MVSRRVSTSGTPPLGATLRDGHLDGRDGCVNASGMDPFARNGIVHRQDLVQLQCRRLRDEGAGKVHLGESGQYLELTYGSACPWPTLQRLPESSLK